MQISPTREVWLLADLGFGDQGKGTTVKFLAHATGAHTVVLSAGGPQAAHTDVLEDGR